MIRVEEIWKDIPGYEGRYQVSNLGRVRGLTRMSGGRRIQGRIFKGHPGDAQGHVVVRLDDRKQHYVHRLVLLAFYRAPHGNEVVRHLNGVPDDNRLRNLAYGSQSENNVDVYRYGKKFKKFGVSEVKQIKKELSQGTSQRSLARKYGVSFQCIYRISSGWTFGWVDSVCE